MNNTINDSFKFIYEEESNKYKNIYEYTSTKIIVIITYTLVETVGNVLWWGIIHYELFGGDPKKRSITNKEISLLFKCPRTRACNFVKMRKFHTLGGSFEETQFT